MAVSSPEQAAVPQGERAEFPPGPKSKILGIDFLARMRRDLLGFLGEIKQQYGDVVRFRCGWMNIFVVFHPEHVLELLVKKSSHMVKTKRHVQVFGKWNGNSIFMSEGATWIRHRRMVQTGFHPRRIQAYAQTMIEVAQATFSSVELGRPYDISKSIGDLTLNVTVRALFGTDVEDMRDEFRAAVDVINRKALRELYAPFVLPDWMPLPQLRRERRAIATLRGTIDEIIRRRRASGNVGDDLLGQLLAAVDEEGDGKGMSDQQVRDEATTLILAGHETTATALAWSVHLLSTHPEAQERVHQEVKQVTGGRLQTEHLDQLIYTQAVLAESMRLLPPAYVLTREAGEPTSVGEYAIEKGDMIIFAPFIMQRDPRWFPDPLKFDPGRFLPGWEERIVRGAYIPFGAGPRTCIGKSFALAEGTLALATLFQNHCVLPAPGFENPAWEVQVSLHPKGGLPVVIRPRHAPAN